MSPSKGKKRTSILKKRQSPGNSPNAATSTTKPPRKGILFSEKKTVKEFLQCDEKATIWGNSYETSMAKSEASSDGSQTSKKLSFDFSSSNIQTTTMVQTTVYTNSAMDISERENEEISTISTPNSSNSGMSLDNMTVEINAEEKRRIKKYGTGNLNITNMNLEQEKMILSPRKTIFFNQMINTSVSVQDKVLMKPAELANRESILMNISSDLSINMEEDEADRFKANERKTILAPKDMNLTLQRPMGTVPKPSVFRTPQLPKPLVKPLVSSSVMDSPPIKHPKTQDHKKAVEDIVDFMVTDTPTKNLCHQMCSSKKHKITPLQEQPVPKIVFSATKSQWFNRPITGRLAEPQANANNSFELLKTFGLDVKSQGFNESMELEVAVTPPVKQKNIDRKTLFLEDISIEETADAKSVPTDSVSTNISRKTLFGGEVDESSKNHPANHEKTFFDVSADETQAASKSLTFVRMKDLSEAKPVDTKARETVFKSDISITGNYSELPKGNLTDMNFTSMNDTGMSETTAELAAKASRLLKDPMATTASTSYLFTRSYQHENIEDSLSSQNEIVQQLPSESRQRKTIYDSNISLVSQETSGSRKYQDVIASDINISGIELSVPNEAAAQELSKQPSRLVKNSRKTILGDTSMDTSDNKSFPVMEEETKVQIKTNKQKSRETILETNTMDITNAAIHYSALSTCPASTSNTSNSFDETAPEQSTKSSKVRITIYEDIAVEDKIEDQPGCEIEVPIQPELLAENLHSQTVRDEMEVSATRHATYSQIAESLFIISPNNTANFQAQSLLHNSKDSFPLLLTPPEAFMSPEKNPVDDTIEPEDLEEEEAVGGCNLPLEEEAASNSDEEGAVGGSDEVKSVNRTFVSKRDDGNRLMNITDADILSLLDDESDPCLNESESFVRKNHRVSFGSNVSTYQKSLQDFLNNTIQNSPLCRRVMLETPAASLKVKERVFSSPIDYCAKLDELTDILESKDKKELPPRLEIDEWLAKLNIKPVKLPDIPKFDADYVKKWYAGIQDSVAKNAAERKAKEKQLEKLRNSLLPEIPSRAFLFKNKLDCEDEVIKKNAREKVLLINRIFPIARDFDFLLNNKFETDKELSKLWEVDTSFAWQFNQYKFKHKIFSAFKVNITFPNHPDKNPNDSTDPIYFKDVFLYTNPDYRHTKLSLRLILLMRSFRRAIGTDNLTSICKNFNQLISFLDYYHSLVLKVYEHHYNFCQVVLIKSGGIMKLSENEETVTVSNRLFDKEDIVDVNITINGCIEDVSINDVEMKGHKYSYQLDPGTNFSAMKGLMLIEVIMFDIKKFLLGNFQRDLRQ